MSQGPLRWDRVNAEPVMLIWVPPVLLLASIACTLLSGLADTGASLIAMIVLSLVVALMHVIWLRAASVPFLVRVLGFAVQLCLSAALIYVSPFFGIYGFIGYVMAMLLFDGPVLFVALGANALLMAASQVGGIAEIGRAAGAFATLFVVNTAVVTLLHALDLRRERDSAARESALRELQEAQRRNAELQAELLTRAREQGVLEERSRLSREIHDTVAQDLVAIVSQLEAIVPGSDWQQRVTIAKTLAREGLAEARRAVAALRSPMLDDQTLPMALTDLVDAWSTVHDIPAAARVEGTPVPTADDQNLLRICQEALSNVSRHSAATLVEVTLAYVDEGVLLDVRDDGAGFDLERVRHGNGLRNMEERVRGSGGTVEVDTAVGGGCLVHTVVPA